MPNYTPLPLELYKPDQPTDNFGSVFLPGLSDNFEKINTEIAKVPYDFSKEAGVATDGSADASAAIQNQINQYGAVKLKEGATYSIKSPLIGRIAYIEGNGAKIISDFNGPALNFAGALLFSRSVTADYTAGEFYLTLNDVTGIEPGQLIHIQSTESYNSERLYYRRGGNALITHIDGLKVYISHPLPASMTAANINICEIYEPADVVIKNLEVECTLPLAATGGTDGILISYGANCLLDRVNVDKFTNNIQIDTNVNTTLLNCRTRRSYWDGTGTSYGILNNSCTGLLLINCITASGRHGYTSGGEEPVIGTTCINCSFMNETDTTVSFDTHGNNYNTHLINCHIDRFGVNGNVKFDFCTITGGNADDHHVYPAVAYNRASYEFNNCRFLGTNNIKVVGYTQEPATDRKYIDKIIVNDCTSEGDLSVWTQLEDTIAGIKAEIRTVEINNTHRTRLLTKDNIQNFIYNNGGWYSDSGQISQSSGLIDEYHITDSIIANRYLSINITNFRFGELRNLQLTAIAGKTDGRLNISGAGTLSIIDCDLTGLHQGVQHASLNQVNLRGSEVKWYTAPASIKKMTGDVLTDSAGKHWRLVVGTTGAPANVAYA